MSQVKPLKLLANGELSFIDSVNDELTMKSITTKQIVIESESVGEKLSLTAVMGDNIVFNVRDENDVSVASIDKDGNMVVQDLTVNGVETVIGNMVAQSELTVEGDFTVQGNTYLGNSTNDRINFVGKADTNLDMNGKTVTGLAAGVGLTDAATFGQLGAVELALDGRLDSVELLVNNLNSTTVSALGLRVTTLESEMNQAQLDINNEESRAVLEESLLRSRLSTAEGEIDTLQTEMNQAQLDITNEEDRAILEEGIIRSRLSNAEGEIDILRSEKDQAQLDITNEVARALAAEANEVARALAAEAVLSSRILTAEGEINTLQTEMNLAQSDILFEVSRALAAESALTTRVSTAEGEIDTLQTEMNQAQADIISGYQAFSSYFLSNNSAVSALDVRVSTIESDYATTTYVDEGLAGKLDLAGGTMLGSIDMSGFKITSLANPTSSGDAVTKYYVDSAILSNDAALLFTALGDIPAGSPVFVVSGADDTVSPGDASSVGTSRLVGIAEFGISDANSGKVKLSGFATIPSSQIDGGVFTIGSPVYLSENAGKLTSTAPTTPGSRVYQVGVATKALKLVIDLKQGITVA